MDVATITATAAALRMRADRGRPTTFTPRFRGAALDAQAMNAGEWILAGPAETGKTFGGLYRLDTLLRRTPRAKGILLRKVRAHMTGTVLATWERVIAIRGGVEKFGGENVTHYVYPNGSVLWVIGLDQPGRVLSAGVDFIYVCQAEELVAADWETLTTRVTGREAVTAFPMIFGDCNPGPPGHWIINRPALRVLHSRHEDNPTLYDEAGAITEQGSRTMRILDALTGVRKERLRFGRWVAAEGVVYEGFERGVHVVPAFVIPREWRRFRAIDFGFTNPFVCQWWAMDPDGRLYLYREIYRTGVLVEDHARAIVRASAGERYEVTVADHDAEDRATLARYGVHTIPAFKAITPGIQAVAARLARAADGRARMFVLEGAPLERDRSLAEARRPTCTAEEFEVYSWPKAAASGKPEKEEPVKEHDHGMDAARYLVAHVDRVTDQPGTGWVQMFDRAAAARGGR